MKESYAMPTDPTEREDTYVIDPENAAETARLMYQAQLLNKELGGLFPKGLDLSNVHDILDIACGPGGWVLDVAYEHPEMQVMGVDISQTTVEYARAQAWSRGLSNVNFRIMDVLKPLDFADNSFDLVNGRLLYGFMPAAAWPKLLQECMRITRPGGLICLTECEMVLTNSFASEKLASMFGQAMKQAGLSFSPDGRNVGITPMLGHLLSNAGYQDIEKMVCAIDYSAGAEGHESHYQNLAIGSKLVQPFLIKMKLATQQELDKLYQQFLIDMMGDDFCGIWYYLSVWGRKAV